MLETIETVVNDLTIQMDGSKKASLADTDRNLLPNLRQSELAYTVADEYGLWGENQVLYEACAKADGGDGYIEYPDGSVVCIINPLDAAFVIIVALWMRLQNGDS